MAELKMPEINSVIIAGNLTKDPVFRQTNSGGTPVVNFSIACNRRFRDSNHQWQEDVCYVGVVAWNKLAESCRDNLRKSSAVLVDGELQSRTWKAQDGTSRTVVEIKARRIQFLNKRKKDDGEDDHDGFIEDDFHDVHHEDAHGEDNDHIYEYKYLSSD
ncbi:MAG: single-stranded DNA-binding protein [Pelodictyon luteolum]|jgi:single-strand DNA-binding protein|uniref:Single-stranded DNA-binding protein n=1 Tax=Pelodictyon luteolum TaxID=1100 RepID=A0A165L7Y3_PELLU|nr:single-stranded DNA-binding protein [Pelodictyon luteolum]KZK73689.1 MAG: single-stranded DNA-binding protein [Pelodictyon luteolum]